MRPILKLKKAQASAKRSEKGERDFNPLPPLKRSAPAQKGGE